MSIFDKTKRMEKDQVRILLRGKTEQKEIKGKDKASRAILGYEKKFGFMGFGLQYQSGEVDFFEEIHANVIGFYRAFRILDQVKIIEDIEEIMNACYYMGIYTTDHKYQYNIFNYKAHSNELLGVALYPSFYDITFEELYSALPSNLEEILQILEREDAKISTFEIAHWHNAKIPKTPTVKKIQEVEERLDPFYYMRHGKKISLESGTRKIWLTNHNLGMHDLRFLEAFNHFFTAETAVKFEDYRIHRVYLIGSGNEEALIEGTIMSNAKTDNGIHYIMIGVKYGGKDAEFLPSKPEDYILNNSEEKNENYRDGKKARNKKSLLDRIRGIRYRAEKVEKNEDVKPEDMPLGSFFPLFENNYDATITTKKGKSEITNQKPALDIKSRNPGIIKIANKIYDFLVSNYYS